MRSPPLLLAALALVACGEDPRRDSALVSATPAAAAPGSEVPVFVDRATPAGLDFRVESGRDGRYFMPEIMGSGAALFDYDDDGDLDLYLVQGRPLGADRRGGPAPSDRLLRNDLERGPEGTLEPRFTDVTEAAGLVEAAYGMGVAAADFDSDGRVDLYVTNLGPNRLLRNAGDGTFEDVTEVAGVGDPLFGSSASFFDFDRDGWLDLYLANYLSFDDEVTHQVCPTPAGRDDYCGPVSFQPELDRLWRNRGDGTFEDVSLAAGIHVRAGTGLGVVSLDFDRDGWLDLFVANDKMPNFLWHNQGDGSFREVALEAGCAVNEDGLAEAGMGVDAADIDADGDEDLVLAHVILETNTLYLNEGGAWFRDASTVSGLGPPSRHRTGFGAAWLDFDNDGRLDLLVANGRVLGEPEQIEAADPFPYHQPNQLFRGLGGGRFAEHPTGPALSRSRTSRGLAVGDVDNDGDLDAVVTNIEAPAELLINTRGQASRWLGLRLVGGTPGRDMLGAEAALVGAGGARLLRRVRSDGSYGSARDPRLLFGLGERSEPVTVEVLWPDGARERFGPLAPGRYHLLRRGEGA